MKPYIEGEIVEYFPVTDTISALDTPYHKAHMENGYDCVLVGLEGINSIYKMIIFDENNQPVASFLSRYVTEQHELYRWANQVINDLYPREKVISSGAAYLDKRVMDDATIWAQLERETRIIANRARRRR